MKKNLLALQDAMSSVTYKDWYFYVREDAEGRAYLQLEFFAPDNCGQNTTPQPQRGRKWYLSPHMTKTELVRTAYAAVRAAEEHEMNEQFKYRGRPIANPHINVNALWDIAYNEELRG